MKRPTLGNLSLLITGFFALLFFTLCFYSARHKSITSDEVAHIPAGYMIWKTGDFRINIEHPPLVKLWSSLPLLPFKFYVPTTDPDWIHGEEWHFGGYFLYMYNDADVIGILARFPIMVLGIIIGWLVYFWGRRLFVSGREVIAPLAGLFAAALYFTEPNLMAHSSLVTYDLPFALLTFGIGFCYWKMHTEEFTLARLSLFIVLMGVSLLIKVVGVFLWFLIFAHFFFAALFSRRKWRYCFPGGKTGRWKKRWKRLCVVICVGLLCCLAFLFIVWASYGFRYAISPGLDVPPGPQAEKFLNFPPIESPLIRGSIMFLQKHRVLPQGYLAVLGHAFLEKDRFSIMLGKTKNVGGFYSYFLVTTILKTPLVHLVLFCLSLAFLISREFSVLFLRRKRRFDRRRFYAHRARIPLYLTIGFFLLITLSKLNLGHRLILMIIPLECLLAGNVLLIFLSRITRFYRRVFTGLFFTLILVAPLFSYPHYIAYFNPIIGSRDKAFLYLTDSNVDWGQDVKLLGRHLRENGIKKVNLSLFGTADPFYYGIQQWIDLGSWMILIPRHKTGPPDYTLPTAVSMNMLVFLQRNYPEVIRTGKPELIGGSILLFPPYFLTNP